MTRVITPWRRLPDNDRWTVLLLLTIVAGVGVLAREPGIFDNIPTVCVMRRLGGFCPGCGLTRACVAVARCDFTAALRFNVLVFFVIPFAIARLLNVASLVICGHARCILWPHWITSVYQFLFITVTIALAAIRLASWALPQCNPGGFGLPPDGHP